MHESAHGKLDATHEALHRQSYTERMLQEFGEELSNFKGHNLDFRSQVLTLVLQRQMQGVADCYAPAIFKALVATDSEEVTIADATDFYLSVDPVHPKIIPSYQRNIVYICEACWHLAVLLGKISVGSKEAFHQSIVTQDLVMSVLQEEVMESGDVKEDVYFQMSKAEVGALVFEELDELFQDELLAQVRAPGPLHYTP